MNTLLFCIGVFVCVHALFSDLTKIARWLPVRLFLDGLFGGLGVRASGVLRRPRPRRRARLIRSARAALDDEAREPRRPQRWRGREDQYAPWYGEGDDWPSNLPPAREPPRITRR